MRIQRLIVVFLLILGGKLCAQSWYQVSFTDKATATKPALSVEALKRRVLHGIHLDSTDFPVSPVYLQQLISMGVKPERVSRWLNCVICQIDSVTLKRVQQLHFVQEAKPIVGFTKKRKQYVKKPTGVTLHAQNGKVEGISNTQLTQLQIDKLHQIGYYGQGMLIAVFDNGFENVPKIGAFSRTQIIDTYNFVIDTAEVYAAGTHGTQVLSVMAADPSSGLIGAAPFAKFALYVTEDNNSETLTEEFNWVVAAERADSVGARIFTTSLGYTTFDNGVGDHSWQSLDGNTTPITQAANMAARKGSLVINSAGNEGNKSWRYITPPADGDSVLAVGSVNASGVRSSFSSVGNNIDGQIKPDLVTMGEQVTVITSSGQISTANGTSFSCPLLAGLSACLWQSVPNQPAWNIKEALIRSADRFQHPDSLYGYGMPHAVKSFKLLTEKAFVSDKFVFPNPASTYFGIALQEGDTAGNAVCQLYDTSGKCVFQQTYSLPQSLGVILVFKDQLKLHENSQLFLLRLQINDKPTYVQKIVLTE